MLSGLIESWKLMMRPKVFQSMASVLIDFLKMFFLLAQSIFLIRSTGNSLYESYFLAVCATSFLPQLVGPIDFAIPRFLRQINRQEAVSLLGTILFVKLTVVATGSIMILSILNFTSILDSFSHAMHQLGIFTFILIMLRSVILAFTSILLAILQSEEEYYFLNRQMLVLTVIEFIPICTFYFFVEHHAGLGMIWAVSVTQFTTCIIQIISTSKAVKEKRPNLFKEISKDVFNIKRNYSVCSKIGAISYTAPLTASGLGGYIRDFFPGLIWSASFQPGSLASIRVWQQLIDAISNAVPKALRFALPTALRINGGKDSERFINAFHLIYPIATCFIAIGIFFTQNLVETIWKIPEVENQNSLIGLLGASLIVGCWGQVVNYHGLMGKNLTRYFYVSISRTILVDAFLVSFLIASFGIIGVGFARLSTVAYSFVGLSLISKKGSKPLEFIRTPYFKVSFVVSALLIAISLLYL